MFSRSAWMGMLQVLLCWVVTNGSPAPAQSSYPRAMYQEHPPISTQVYSSRQSYRPDRQDSYATPVDRPPVQQDSERPVADFASLARRLEDAEAEIARLTEEREAQQSLAGFQQPGGVAPDCPGASKKDTVLGRAAEGPVYPNVQVHGVVQADMGWFQQSANSLRTFASPDYGLPGGRIHDGADFRRARLSANGDLVENMKYFLQMDFAFFGRPTFTDLWMEFNALPGVGNLRVGQWKQPFSLEVVSSFRYTTFVERSLVFQTFTPFRHLGVGFYDHNQDLTMTWAVSAIKTGQDQFGGSVSTKGGNGLAARVTYLPWYDEPSEGRYMMHLGAGYYGGTFERGIARYRTIPELFIGEVAAGVSSGPQQQPIPGSATNGTPFFVDTGPIAANYFNTFGSEVFVSLGPLSFQSEAMCSILSQANGTTVALPGAYAQVGYFLTGEHRPYDRNVGAIDNVKPFENFFRARGKSGDLLAGSGAWEVAARWSIVDLSSRHLAPSIAPGARGSLNDVTLGLNWYFNPQAKLQLNFIQAYLNNANNGHSTTNMYDARVQFFF